MPTKKTERDLSPVQPVVDPFVQEVERIVFARHSDPFQILGPHWIEREGARSLAVRAFRPGAVGASIVWGQSKTIYQAHQIHSAGFFEALLPRDAVQSANTTGEAEISPDAYRVRFRFADGSEIETYDPYAFPAVLTDYDLYLLGEGTHYQNYEKLGRARPRNCRRSRRSLCRLGAERAARQRRWRFQSLGRPHAPDAEARRERHLGTFHAWPRRRHALQI